MIWLDARAYDLAELTLPDDWQDRLAAARNKELSASIKATRGPIHLPVIENATGEIVAGVDRIAAQVVGGETRFECRGWVGAPEEKRMVRAAENAFRRQDADRWATEYLEAKRSIRAANASQRTDQVSGRGDRKPQGGHPKTETGELRDEAAKELGMQPEAYRSRLRREAEMDAEPSSEPAPPPKPVTLKARIRNVVNELGDVLLVAQAFVDETSERAQRADEARDIYRDNPRAPSVVTMHQQLLSARGLLEEAHGYFEGAIREMERMESAVRAADGPPRPRTGLGGRKL